MDDVCLAMARVFFFQAEDGIRDLIVTGVQTCALPISADLGQAETRVRRRRPDVGREQEFEAASDAIPVHRRNDWLRVRSILEQRVIDYARRLLVGGEIAAHVGARAERALARPGEDDAATGAVEP